MLSTTGVRTHPSAPPLATPAAAGSRLWISRWTGEFVNPAVEAAFREAVRPEWARRIRAVALLAGVLILSFGYVDYDTLGWGPALWVAWGLRLALLFGAALVAAVTWRSAQPRHHDAAALAYMLLLSGAIVVLVYIERKGIARETPAALLAALGFYLFVPTRFVWQVICSVGVTAGFLAAQARWGAPKPAELASAATSFVLCNVLSAYTALQTHMLRRREHRGRRRLDERLRFEALIARLSTGFIGLPLDQVDAAIGAALAQIGEFAGADRSFVVVFDWDGGTQSATHAWCGEGVASTLAQWQRLPLREPAWVMNRLVGGEVVYIRRDSDIPPEEVAVREMMRQRSVHAAIMVPMMLAGRAYGFVGFSSVREHAEWLADPVTLLRITGEMIVNVLERKRAELELHSRKQAVEAANKALVESNVELQQFAYIASHDLQEPLRSISGYATLLATRYGDRFDASGKDFLGYLTTSAHRLHTMIVNLLDYSRVDSRPKPFVRCSTRAIVRDAMSNLQASMDELGAHVECESLPVVEGDPSQLLQLFQNLIGNALKFHNGSAPEVRISARRDGARWEFAVADNGIGIDPKYRDRLFRVFSRLHTTDQYPGTGIGLAVCKRIVERHRGQIDVQPNQPAGSVFRFTLPAVD